jgi:hypothetical protein
MKEIDNNNNDTKLRQAKVRSAADLPQKEEETLGEQRENFKVTSAATIEMERAPRLQMRTRWEMERLDSRFPVYTRKMRWME